jgi:hypothetical protein
MRTIHEDDWVKFLLKARAKKSQLEEEKANPLTQLEVDDRNSYCISSIILLINYNTLDQLQGKFLEK